jgi:hypothetical protein
MTRRSKLRSGADALEVGDILENDLEVCEHGQREVMGSYEFDIPESPLEQLVRVPARVSVTEHGLYSTAMLESVCGRALRVDVAGSGEKEAVRRLIRETIQKLVAEGCVLLWVLPMVAELNGVQGAAIFFRKPGVQAPLLWAMPNLDELAGHPGDVELIDEDDIDAEFEMLKTPLPGEEDAWFDESGVAVPAPEPGAYNEEIEALKRTGRGESDDPRE